MSTRAPGNENTRVRDSQEAATAEEERARASGHQRQARLRREHAAQWYEYEMLLAQNHRKLSEEHAARALALLDELRGFYAVDDDAKELRPYLQHERPGSGEAQRYTLSLGGVQSTQTAFGNRVAGLERGQLEGVIASLARLGEAYPEAGKKSTDAA
jgi:hypothetical protein